MKHLEKLEADLAVLEFMVSKMAGYLAGNNLFGPTNGKMPKTTLGGFLMRHYRLNALRVMLPTAVTQRIEQVNMQFEDIRRNNIVRTEKKGTQEFGARLRQWEAYIREVRRDTKTHAVYYGTAVEPRAMLAELHKMLTTPPYKFSDKLTERLDLLDAGLSGVWQTGEFVWPEQWAIAYPAQAYWWLYGQPVNTEG